MQHVVRELELQGGHTDPIWGNQKASQESIRFGCLGQIQKTPQNSTAVLDRGLVGAPQRQNPPHEVPEGQRLAVLEEEPSSACAGLDGGGFLVDCNPYTDGGSTFFGDTLVWCALKGFGGLFKNALFCLAVRSNAPFLVIWEQPFGVQRDNRKRAHVPPCCLSFSGQTTEVIRCPSKPPGEEDMEHYHGSWWGGGNNCHGTETWLRLKCLKRLQHVYNCWGV